MEINRAELIGQKLSRIFKISICSQCIGVIVLGLLVYFEPLEESSKRLGQVFSILGFIIAFLISRSYFYTEQKLEEFEAVSHKSSIREYNERFLLFFFPYIFWGGCIGVFSFG